MNQHLPKKKIISKKKIVQADLLAIPNIYGKYFTISRHNIYNKSFSTETDKLFHVNLFFWDFCKAFEHDMT
jgi:hypothetical protein